MFSELLAKIKNKTKIKTSLRARGPPGVSGALRSMRILRIGRIGSDFTLGLGITGRPLFQSLMCVERYLAVVHPVTFLKYKPLRYRVICCTAVWIIVLGSCLCCLFTIVSCNFYVYVCCFVLQFLLFFSIVLSCGCSQSSEAVRTRRERERRERGGKPHEEKSILSYKYCEHVYYIYSFFYPRILFHSDSTLYSGTF